MKRIEVIGNVGRDATISDFNGNKAINFNIAENEYYTDDNGNKVEKTTWFSCTYWRRDTQSTKIADYIKKGTKIFVEGTPEPKSYTKDGKTIAYIQINIKNIELISKAQNQNQTEHTSTNTDNNDSSDDLPF
jgi:single-strand DNA-binding protein